jgi:HAD superfamily hydrolase (TIGR01450 family)
VNETLLERYRAFAIDLDGVVWRADRIIPEAPAAISAIRAAGKPLLFLTNNASYLPPWIVGRLAQGGMAVAEDEILTSAAAARDWIKREGLVGARAFVLGTQPVIDQMADLLEVVPVARGTEVDLVFVARDLEINYDRLAAASQAVRNGAVFAASNRDNVMPIVGGFDPGTGSVLAAVESASGRRAVSMGKPELPMMQAAAERLGTTGVLMIGDRADSDVAGARAIGWAAALVMTGVSRPGMALDPAPDYVLETLGDLPGYRHGEAAGLSRDHSRPMGGPMIDQVRDTLRKASKAVEAPRQRAEEAVRKVAENPNFDLMDAPQAALNLLRRGREQADKARGALDNEIRRRLSEMGLATQEEVDRLRRRIAELEAVAEEDRPAPPRRASPAPRARTAPPAAPPSTTTLPAATPTGAEANRAAPGRRASLAPKPSAGSRPARATRAKTARAEPPAQSPGDDPTQPPGPGPEKG